MLFFAGPFDTRTPLLTGGPVNAGAPAPYRLPHPFGAHCRCTMDSFLRVRFSQCRPLSSSMLRTNFAFAKRIGGESATIFLLLIVFSPLELVRAAPAPVHGLWVWKSASVLEAPNAAETLLNFCAAQNVNEVYISISERSAGAEEAELVHLITLLHRSNIRAEALLSSTDADEPGKHRETLLRHVRGIVEFNQRHAAARFDGFHLDIEPQQRPDNKGSGNLGFLPGLVQAFRAVRVIAEPAGMNVNADIQNKLLKGDLAERRLLLSAVSRVTLMMYELSRPGDGDSPEQQAEKVQKTSQKYLDMAYDGLPDGKLAKMVIALRTMDYGALLPQMLQKLDDVNRSNPHYLGWARHSYSNSAKPSD